MCKKFLGKFFFKIVYKVECEYCVFYVFEYIDVIVFKIYCFCEDDFVIGMFFYVMEFFDGCIFEDFIMLGVSVGECIVMWCEVVCMLVRFYSVDFRKVGLEKFGKDKGFYGR